MKDEVSRLLACARDILIRKIIKERTMMVKEVGYNTRTWIAHATDASLSSSRWGEQFGSVRRPICEMSITLGSTQAVFPAKPKTEMETNPELFTRISFMFILIYEIKIHYSLQYSKKLISSRRFSPPFTHHSVKRVMEA